VEEAFQLNAVSFTTDGIPLSPSPVRGKKGCVVTQKCYGLKIQGFLQNNRSIPALFQRDIVSIPYVSYWNTLVTNICCKKKVWLLPHKYLLVNKVK
jgi:hypothetical protein